jgi:hypothetical protein
LLAAAGGVAVAVGAVLLAAEHFATWLATAASLSAGAGALLAGIVTLSRLSRRAKRALWTVVTGGAVALAFGLVVPGRGERYEVLLVNETNQTLDVLIRFADGAEMSVRDLGPGSTRVYRAFTAAPCAGKVAIVGFGAGQVVEAYASCPSSVVGYAETIRLGSDDSVRVRPATLLERLGLG